MKALMQIVLLLAVSSPAFAQQPLTLDRAIQSAPDNRQIKESRALIDQMATKK